MSGTRPTREQAVEDVLTLREGVLATFSTDRVALDELGGRVLADPVVAERDVPARSEATMDGYAVAAADDPPLTVAADRASPGDEQQPHEPGTAVPVATGGPVPDGADAVVVREDATVDDGTLTAGEATAGQHVLARGTVVSTGETVLEAGRRLAPRDAAVLRDLGVDGVVVRDRISAALLATGTEIHEGREPDRDSETLANLVRSWGATATLAGSVPDDPGRVGERIAALAADHDVVVTTGGTGVSAADETAGALANRADVRVADAAMGPGSGTTVAWLPSEDAVVASLPGPPGAMFASATLLLRPLFVGSGTLPTVTATASRALSVPDRDIEFVVPVEFVGETERDADGSENEPAVVPFGHPDSSAHLYDERFRRHLVSSCARLSAADGFVLTRDGFGAGETVAVVPYSVVES